MNKIEHEDKATHYSRGGWRAHYILIICSLLYIINCADRQVFSAVLQPMKIELGLTDAECGLAQTIFLLGMSIFAFPVAYLIDRWSRNKAIAIMAIIWSALTYMTGLAKNFVGVIIPRSFVGVGEAGFAPGGVALIGASYPSESRGKVLGIFNASLAIGFALGSVLGGSIATDYGWRYAFFCFAIPGVILGILALFIKDYKTVSPVTASGEKKGFASAIITLLKIPTLRWFYLGYGLLNFTSMSALAWIAAFAMRSQNMSAAAAGMLVGGIVLASIVGPPLSGFLADYWQRKKSGGRIYVASLSSIVGSALLVIAYLSKMNEIGIVAGILYGITYLMAVPVLGSISQDVVPVAHKGLSFGFALLCAYAFGGAWGPYFVGGISDIFGGGTDGLGNALLISTAGAFIGGILMFFAAKHYAPDMDKVKEDTVLMAA